MRLSSLFKSNKPVPSKSGDQSPDKSGARSRNAARIAEATTLMAQRACGQAINALKDIKKEAAEPEVWLMRAALYVERGDIEKARGAFSNMIEALVKESQDSNKRDCWLWLPGVDAAHAATWSAAVPAHLATFHLVPGADGLIEITSMGRKSDVRPPEQVDGATPAHRALTCLVWAARHGAVLASPLGGGILKGTIFADQEASALDQVGRRSLIIPTDEEVACLSKIYDPCVRYAWLTRDPGMVKRERTLQQAITDWTVHAGLIVSHFQLDAQGRWDVLIPRFTFLDPAAWPVSTRSGGALRVLHFDDHADFAGTIFIQDAASKLATKGIAIELTTMKRGDEAARRRAFAGADVYIDGLNVPGYSPDAVEAMASGLVVVSNLDSEFNCQVFRRYSFLDECPVRSATPETIGGVLDALAADKTLVEKAGAKGREYVATRHSIDAATKLFGRVAECFALPPRIEKTPRPSLVNYYHPKQWALNHKPAPRA